jgi:hypothetical protein
MNVQRNGEVFNQISIVEQLESASTLPQTV